MKVYVAGKAERREAAAAVMAALREVGHTITRDWTVFPPHDGDPILMRKYAIADLAGIANAEIFVLLPGDVLSGANVEFGAALMQALRQTNRYIPNLFILGEYQPQNVFWPLAVTIADLPALLAQLAELAAQETKDMDERQRQSGFWYGQPRVWYCACGGGGLLASDAPCARCGASKAASVSA